MAELALAERTGIRGRITFTNVEIASQINCGERHTRAEEIDEYLSTARNIPRAEFLSLVGELCGICPRPRTLTVTNHVVIGARSEMVKRLIGTQVYTGTIKYGALGTGSTAVTDADTQLDTEAARALLATATQTDDSISLDFYFSKASTNGTYEEFGLFIDGTASADSGLLFNRALTGGWTKSNLEAMTVSVQINLNAA